MKNLLFISRLWKSRNYQSNEVLKKFFNINEWQKCKNFEKKLQVYSEKNMVLWLIRVHQPIFGTPPRI